MTLLWQQLIEMAQYEGDDSDNLETTGIARIKHKVSLPISYRLQYLQRAEGLPGQKKKQLHLNTLAYPVSSVIEDKFQQKDIKMTLMMKFSGGEIALFEEGLVIRTRQWDAPIFHSCDSNLHVKETRISIVL
ncbi:hypothetical protein R3P38DRAFT_2810299 [Favolaschia claudopus]|uniref:Uncharacterized protein n=1 Tax=Favolaschia claudopus TaxID=2862362 RepID=A0AAV9ZBC0_9AGAR